MRTYYDAIYLSPHLDDAALSCGGQIHQQTSRGDSVLVVTVMAGDPPAGPLSAFARSLHARWGLPADEVVAGRRAEDVAACQLLGAEWAHWPFADAVYRCDGATGAPLYPTWEDVIAAPHAADEALVDELAQRMADLPAAGRILAPLAVGNHMDHQLTRLAAVRCFGAGLWYYEDYPYVLDAAATAVVPTDDPQWQAEIMPVPPLSLQMKIAGIAAFASQVGSFFSDRPDLEQKMTAFTARVGGERVWRQTAV